MPRLSCGIPPGSRDIPRKGPHAGAPCHARHPCRSRTVPCPALVPRIRFPLCYRERFAWKPFAVAKGRVAAIDRRIPVIAASVPAGGIVWSAVGSRAADSRPVYHPILVVKPPVRVEPVVVACLVPTAESGGEIGGTVVRARTSVSVPLPDIGGHDRVPVAAPPVG